MRQHAGGHRSRHWADHEGGAGTGVETVIDGVHPGTGRPTTGTPIPDWEALTAVAEAVPLLPGIRPQSLRIPTKPQSWDIALTDVEPMPLEVNFGDDFNLAKLASGTGVLDANHREHLRRCGYRL
jgi:hypothetical protein